MQKNAQRLSGLGRVPPLAVLTGSQSRQPPDIKVRVAAAKEADRLFPLRQRHERAANRAARLLTTLANMPVDTPTYLRNVTALHFAEAAVATARLQAEMNGGRP